MKPLIPSIIFTGIVLLLTIFIIAIVSEEIETRTGVDPSLDAILWVVIAIIAVPILILRFFNKNK